MATTPFTRAGWALAATGGRVRASEYAERNGEGRWYCPRCASKKNA
jgi:hypothetical protein